MSLTQRIDVNGSVSEAASAFDPSSAVKSFGMPESTGESVTDYGTGGFFSPVPANQIVDQDIVVTQTTNYSNYSLVDDPGITFQTAAASTATFLATQFNNPGHIDPNATITGDSNADTIAVAVNTPLFDGGWGFDGSQLQLANWSGSDKFDINVVSADVPDSAHLEVNGTSGNDIISLGAGFNSNDAINGEGGSNTLKLSGDYSVGTEITSGMLQNVDRIDLAAGNSYFLTMGAGVVPTGQTTVVDAAALGVNDSFQLETAFDSDGKYTVYCGAGANAISLNDQADTIYCGTGTNEIFAVYGMLPTSDRIVGAGTTLLELGGTDYSAGYSFSSRVTGLTELTLNGGENYKLTTNDANVADGVTLLVSADNLGTGDSFYFNGSHETNGAFQILGGAGMNTLIGGAENDAFEFDGTGAFTAADRINGEGGNGNGLYLSGDYSAGLKFEASTIVNIQNIQLSAGDSYNLTMADGNVAAGQTLTISGTALGATDTLIFNGSKETNGNFDIYGGAGSDVLTGGAGNDQLVGGGGADTMNGGAGNDTFVYNAVSDSTSTTHDTIIGFNAATDQFHLLNLLQNPSAIDATVTSGTLRSAAFDSDLAHAIGANLLHAGDAVLFTPTGGNLAGHTILVIDENGVAGYQGGQDIVIELTAATNMAQFGTANFQ